MTAKVIIPLDILENIIDKYEEGTSVLQLSKLFPYKYDVLHRVIREHGVDIRGNDFNSRKYTYNTNFFDVIDNEIKAYWLGFIYADGYVTKRGNTFQLGIALAKVDKNHLEKFKEAIDSDIEIHDYIQDSAYKKGTEYSRIIVSNNHLCEQLMAKGVYRKKTEKITFPSSDILPDHLVSHFVRGYYDGDGCLTGVEHPERPVRVFQVKILGTKEFLTGLNIVFNKAFLSNGLKEKEFKLRKRWKDSEKNNYTLEIGGKRQVSAILEYMYNDYTVCLSRKENGYNDDFLLEA